MEILNEEINDPIFVHIFTIFFCPMRSYIVFAVELTCSVIFIFHLMVLTREMRPVFEVGGIRIELRDFEIAQKVRNMRFLF